MATTKPKRNISTALRFNRSGGPVIVDENCLPVDYFILAGSFGDVTALQSMSIYLPAGSELYGDKGYTDYEQEDL